MADSKLNNPTFVSVSLPPNVDSQGIPTTTREEYISKIQTNIATAAQTKSANIAAEKARLKGAIITGATFDAEYKAAAATPDYETFMAMPSDLPVEQRRKLWGDARSQELKALSNGKESRIFTDAELNDSVVKATANSLLGAVGRVGDITGNLLNVGGEAAQMLRRTNITEEEFGLVESVKQKQTAYWDAFHAAREETDPAKKAVLHDRIRANSFENYTDAEKGIFEKKEIPLKFMTVEIGKIKDESAADKVRKYQRAEGVKQAIDQYSGIVTDVVNKSSIETMLEAAKQDYRTLSPGFSEGTGMGAVVDLAYEAGKTIVENPEALAQLVVQTVPDIVSASKALPAALAGNVSEKQMEAKQIYRNTYGKDAVGEDLTLLNAGALGAGLIDTFGDKFVGSGGASIVKAAEKLGVTSGSRAVDVTVKLGTQAVERPLTGAVGEFVAEGGGQLLTQLAGKQDIEKVSGADVYAEGVLGAGAGGAITTVTGSLDMLSGPVRTATERGEARKQALAEGSISELVSSFTDMDIKGAAQIMNRIVTSADTTPEQKAQAIADMEGVFNHRALNEMGLIKLKQAQDEQGFTQERADKIARTEAKLADMAAVEEQIKFTKEHFKGHSVEAAYKALTEPTDTDAAPDMEVSRQAAATIDEEVNSPYAKISTDMAKEILDKRADILTEDQVSNLRSYITTNEAMDTLVEKLDENSVRSDIVTGGHGNVGARTYVNAIISAIKIDNPELAQNTVDDLVSFTERHTAKAEAMGKIVASFDAGTPMSAAEQVALMAPFDSKVKGSKFKPFNKGYVPKYARMIGEEANMLQIVSKEMTKRVDQFTGNSVPAGSAPTVGAQAQPEVTPSQGTTLDQLLAMDDTQAIATLNPEGKTLSEEDRVILEPGDIDLPVESKMIKRTADKANTPVEIVEDTTGTMYAVSEGQVVGMIGPGEANETVLDMVQGSEGKGIATELTAEYIRKNPNAKAGGFTKGGEATYKAALRKLRAEKEVSRAQDTGVAEQAPVSQPVSTETTQPTEQLAVPEATTLERETEVETGTVSDEVLNESVVAEQPAVIAETGVPSFLSNLRTISDVVGQTGNAVLDYFTFKSSKAIGNPFISEPNFVVKLKEKGVSIETLKAFLPARYESISAENKIIVEQFLKFNEAFKASVLEVYQATELKFAHSDFASYFIDTNGEFKSTVLDAMSVSAFNWFIAKSSDSLNKDERDLGAILGIEGKGKSFSNYSWATLGKLGLPYTEEVRTMGNAITQSLGLKPTLDAPMTVEGRLSDALGNLAVQGMAAITAAENTPWVKVVVLSAEQREIAHLIEVDGVSEIRAKALVKDPNHVWKTGNKTLRTLQVNSETDANGFRSPLKTIQGMILEPAKSQGSFLQDLFGALSPDVMPTFEPVKVNDQSQVMKRTDRKLSQYAKDVHQKFNDVKTFLKPGMVKAITQFSPEQVAVMFGFETDLKSKFHKDNLEGETSKNNLIPTAVNKVFSFIEAYGLTTKSEDFSAPFYLSHETNRVGRAQLVQRVMNMQSDKIARHMAYRDGWQTKINMNDVDSMDSFTRAVGQALGVSLDKNDNVTSTLKSKAILENPVMVKGIAAAVGLLNDDVTANINDLQAAVMFAGKNAAALDGIMTYAQYKQAEANGDTEFETNIGVERDGITNGPIFTLLQFGDVDTNWANDLSAGGWYIDSPYENVVDAKKAGIKDIYEKVAAKVNVDFNVRESIEIRKDTDFELTPNIKSALLTIFGVLNEKSGDIIIADRTAAKQAVTPKTYQAGDYATSAKLGDSAISIIRSKLETYAAAKSITDPVKLAAIRSEAQALSAALKVLAPGLITVPKAEDGGADYLNAQIGEDSLFKYKTTGKTQSVTMTFAQMISATYGKLFTEAVNEQNSAITALTAETVSVSNMAVMAFDAVRTKLIDDAIAAKAEANPTSTALFKELTRNELKMVEQTLEDIFPEVYTAISKKQGEGISLVSYEATEGKKAYGVSTKLTDLAAPSYTLDGKTIAANKSSTIEGEGTQVGSPGVTGVVSNILALDGATLLKSLDKNPSMLGLFDASMNGLATDMENAKQMNRDMFNTVLDHSVPVEVANMANRVSTKAMQILGNDFTFDQATLDKFKIKDMPELTLNTVSNLSKALQTKANAQQQAKRSYLLSHRVKVNHYYNEGAAVTFVNGQEVDLSTLTPAQLTNEFNTSLVNVVNSVVAPVTQPVNTIAPDTKPNVELPGASSEALNAAFDSGTRNVITVAQALKAFPDRLADSREPTINAVKAITNALIKQLGNDIKVVRYSANEQYTGNLAWLNTDPDMVQFASKSRGMFFPANKTGNVPTVVLMADDMAYPGVNSETLFHELVHALFDSKVYNSANSTVGAELQNIVKAVNKALPQLMQNDPIVRQFVESYGGISQFPALANMREFMAWGLSSAQFQNILSQINYVTTAELANQFMIKPKSVMATLRALVQKVLFNRSMAAQVNVPVDNALKSLIDVALTLQGTSASEASVSRQQGPMQELLNVTKLNSKQVFNRLASIGGNVASVTQQEHLTNMLDTVVNSVLKPLNVNLITASVNENTSDLSATDKLDLLIADNAGIQLTNPPVQYGFNKSAQEAYVHGLYLSILESGLQVGSPHLNAANTLFNTAKDLLTYKDFMVNPNSIDPVEIDSAKARYDNVFNVTTSKVKTITDTSSGMKYTNQQSDYLRNFLALAATNEQFRNALNQVPAQSQVAPSSLFDRVIKLVIKIIDTVTNRITGVSANDTVIKNLDMLTKRLVGAEYAAQSKIESAMNGTLEFSGVALAKALDVFRAGLAKVGRLPVLSNRGPFALGRIAGSVIRIVGNNQTQYAYEAASEAFERLSSGKQGLAGEIATEIKGTTKDNSKVHTLLRVANFVLDRGRKEVIDTMAKTLKSTFKGELTHAESTAVTKHVLRTDLSALVTRGYDLNQLADLVDNVRYRTQEIDSIEAQIRAAVPTDVATFYLNKAHELGATMVHGFSKNVLNIPNAYGIARLWATGRTEPDALTLAHVEPLIDALASLRALERAAVVNTAMASTAGNLVRREAARTDGTNSIDNNGMTFLLEQHRLLKDKALKDNFGNNPALMRKGYMPDITNPYIDAVPGLSINRDEMAAKGYTEAYRLDNDLVDPNQEAMSLFIGDGAGLAKYMRGALSTKGKRAKGNTVQDFADVAIMAAKNYAAIQESFAVRKEPSFSKSAIHMQEVFNERGEINSYRYIMAESTKDTLLERNDDFSEVMGSLAGKIYDKTVTTPHNELVIKTLKEQYDLDMASGKNFNYLQISKNSTDPELRDLYNLLPYEAKKEIKKQFGNDYLPIRAESLRLVFGYRKVSIAQLWQEGGVNNNMFQESVKHSMDILFAGQGMKRASQIERVLMDLTKVAKSNIVVRTGMVTLMNNISNTYTLMINGLNLKTALADQMVGYKKGIEFVKQGSRIAEIDLLLQANHDPANRTKLESERAQLKQLQAINPVGDLIQSGLLQTIVMDVNQDIDPFSHSSILANKFNEQLDRLPGAGADIAKFIFMTRGSESFEFMNKMTQFSDFAARYALYKHLTTRTNKPLDKNSAMQAVIKQFINYDLPTHRAIQYGNDIGLIWFSKYWLRVQKVIVENFADNPGRVLLGMSVQGMLGVDVPDISDSSFLETGLFHPIRGWDSIASGLIANPVVPEL